MKQESATNQQVNPKTFTVKDIDQYQASLLPDLPDDLLRGFAKCDRRRLLELTNSSNKQESEAAWEVLYLITQRLEEVFPSPIPTGPVQYSYWVV